MLIYSILMLALAVFFYREGQKLLADSSRLLQELCKDPYSKKITLSSLRILCLSSAVSAFFMLITLVLSRITDKFFTPLAVLSILCYSVGVILAMRRLKKM